MAKKKGNNLFKLIITVVIIFFVVSALKNYIGQLNFNHGGNNEEETAYYTPASNNYTTQWTEQNNTAQEVEPETKPETEKKKKTKIKGNGKDVVTIMVYMCGTDLESRASMATYDLTEMAKADISDKVNLIVYTGGCTKWHVKDISNKNNMVLKILGDGKYEILESNAGSASMTDPKTLTSFIEYASDRFPANRYELIMWDHGGGTVSGYGHDEHYPNDSMSLSEIDRALTDAKVKFDFIGFDACLMATAENALMLSSHGDYLIASEESEPGIGWYYTDWLNALSDNTSLQTVKIGKEIADSFVSQCSASTPSQPATLSVVDLAELKDKIPEKLDSFASSLTDMINDGDYKTISKARAGSREFGSSAKVDMVDLVDLANNIDNKEAKSLKKALLSCIKYNNASKSMSNSYGLSIYFPYRSSKYVNTVLKTYDELDMSSNYSELVTKFAQVETSGQVASGGTHSAFSIFDNFFDYGDSYQTESSYGDLFDLFGMFLGNSSSQQVEQQYSGSYDDYFGDFSWLFKDGVDKSIVTYINENHFQTDLNWKNGKINLTKEQWDLVDDLALNVFVDDGEGYIDMGYDNIYDIDSDGNLLAIDDLTWLVASNDNEKWQSVPYYYQSCIYDGQQMTSYGTIPVLLNGDKANLMVKMDDEGIEVIGATFTYDDELTVAKNVYQLNEGDQIKFICDYYNYDGTFNDAYVLGDPLTIKDKLYLGDGILANAKVLAAYQIKDIYQQTYWTEVMPN